MSASFTLDYSGPATPCDFPGCTAGAFHEGEHQFLSQQEKNERLAAAVTSYGVGTRSYNRSPERLEVDRQRAEATARYESAAHHHEITLPIYCSCPQRPYPHELSIHSEIRQESFNPKLRTRWPWSLMQSSREEPSTERKEA